MAGSIRKHLISAKAVLAKTNLVCAVLTCAIFAMLLLAAFPARAETFKGEQSGTYYDKREQSDIERVPTIDYRVSWKAWSLLGEPVVDANITWNFKFKGSIVVKRSDGDSSPMPIDTLPAEATQLIRIYDAKLRLHIRKNDSIDRGILEIDLGVPSQAGGPASYNTPASFSWDRLLKKDSFGLGGEYRSAEDAKAFFKNGFQVVGHEIVLKYNVEDFRAFLDARFSPRALNALDRAAGKYIRAIGDIFNLNTFPIEQRHAVIKREAGAAMYDFRQGALDAYKAFVAKLAKGVPPEFRIPSRIDAYETELAAIRDEYEQDMPASTSGSGGTFAKWEAKKRIEIGARKLVAGGDMGGLWVLNQGDYRDPFSQGRILNSGHWTSKRCSSGDRRWGYLLSSCHPQDARCTLNLRVDMTFVLHNEKHGCEITGNYEYSGENSLTGKSGDGLMSLEVYRNEDGKIHMNVVDRNTDDPNPHEIYSELFK